MTKQYRGLKVEIADRILGWTEVQQVDGTFMKVWMGREPGDNIYGLTVIPEIDWSVVGQIMDKFKKLPDDSPLRNHFIEVLTNRMRFVVTNKGAPLPSMQDYNPWPTAFLSLTPDLICQSALDAISL